MDALESCPPRASNKLRLSVAQMMSLGAMVMVSVNAVIAALTSAV